MSLSNPSRRSQSPHSSELATQAPPPLLLTIDDAARLLGISKRALWTLIEDGTIQPVRLGRRITRLRRADIETLAGYPPDSR